MKATLTALSLFSLTLLPVLSQSSPPQGADLLKTDILCVLAHPDDETGMASTLAYYAHGRDAAIANVYCTRGEGGGNMVGTHWGPSLGILREVELKDCLQTLGVDHCFFLDQVDWAYTESAAMTLEKWDKEAALGQLVRLIRNLRPEIILTMNPFPRAGQHGHHQAAGMLAVEAFTAAADPQRYSQQLSREGLQPWQARRLYFRGDSVGPVTAVDAGQALPQDANAHEIAGEALRNHRSQGFGRFQRASFARPPETFGLVKAVESLPNHPSDILGGLPLQESASLSVTSPPESSADSITASFPARPAVTRFLEWARLHEIEHLVSDIEPDLSLPQGTTQTVNLTLHNPTSEERTIEGALDISEGWGVSPSRIRQTVPANASQSVELQVEVPRESSEDATLAFATPEETGVPPIRAGATLHPLPTAEVARTTEPLSLATPQKGWDTLTTLTIDPSHRVQGSSDDANDHSGEVRLAYDDHHLYVDVLVHDQRVVSNIAPNDIRGHWRSDSVEICVDPSGNAEHTLAAFKVGIFPFDQAGAVRAARDADANQGPIEETAPGMRLASARLPAGYRIQTAIPWKVIGLEEPHPGTTIGFNVILYDGDKEDAAPGENINESRLAWAPRSGVQGRPDDWGRITLK